MPSWYLHVSLKMAPKHQKIILTSVDNLNVALNKKACNSSSNFPAYDKKSIIADRDHTL